MQLPPHMFDEVMNRIDRFRARVSDMTPGEQSDLAGLSASVAIVVCIVAWGLLFSAASSELSGVIDHSYRTSYLVAGVLGVVGIAATVVAGVFGRGGWRMAAAVTFWLLVGPALWGCQMIVVVVTE